MPLLSTFGAASARGFGNLSGIALPVDDLFNSVAFLSHFDGSNSGVNNSFEDGSSSNHTITANGNVTQGSFGPFARPEGYWGVNFDGDDGIKTPASGVVDFGTGDFTIEAFFNSNVVDSSNDTIIQNWGGGTGNPVGFAVNRGSSGGIQFYIGSSLILDTGANAFVANTWNHLAVARSGTSLKMFVNGSVVVTATNSGNITVGNSNVSVGYDVQGTNNYFRGSLSNVRIVKGAAVYTSAFTPATAPLTAITNTQLLTCQSNRFVDNSASARTLTLAGNPSVSSFGPFLTTSVYDPAVNGASLFLAEQGSYLSLTAVAAMRNPSSFTLEGWVYLTEAPASGVATAIFALGNAGQDALKNSYSVGVRADLKPRVVSAGFQAETIQSNIPIKLNEWAHLALTWDSTTWSLYQNGVRSGTSTTQALSTSDYTQGYVGRDYYSDGRFAPNAYYTDVRMVTGTHVYSGSTYTVPTAPLTAITNTQLLLNMSDGQAIDSAAQNNLTLYGNAKLSTTQAKFGDTSMYFDGSGDYASIPDSEAFELGGGDFTIEFFINTSQTSSGYFTAMSKWTNSNLSWMIRSASQDIHAGWVFFWGTSGTNYFTLTGASINNGAWRHIAVTRSGNTLRTFTDGTQNNSTTTNVGSFYNGTAPFDIGSDRGGNYFNGYIDEVRISKFARYTSNFTAPTEPFPDKGQ